MGDVSRCRYNPLRCAVFSVLVRWFVRFCLMSLVLWSGISYWEEGSVYSGSQRAVRSLVICFALAVSRLCYATVAHKTDSCTA